MNRTTYAALAAVTSAIVVYGSWVPFQFEAISFAHARNLFADVLTRSLDFSSRSDWAANIALALPLGFALAGAVALDRSRWLALAAAPAILLYALVLATVVEFGQVWLPSRESSINDIVAQLLGTLIGLAGWLLVGPLLTNHLRQLTAALGTTHGPARLLPAYLLFVILIHALPLDLTISPTALWHKFRTGPVHLNPLPTLADLSGEFLQRQLWNAVYFLPLGLLLARRRSLLGVVALGGLFAGLIEAGQFFVASRSCDARDVIVATLAIALGWGLARSWPPAPTPIGWRWAALTAWSAVLLVLSWSPFDFDVRLVAERWPSLGWLPLADYQQIAPQQAIDEFLRRITLFTPLGALAWWSAGRGGLVWLLAGAVGVEAGQLALPGRTPSVSDALIAFAAGGAGAYLLRSCSTLSPPAEPTFWIVDLTQPRWRAGDVSPLFLLGERGTSVP